MSFSSLRLILLAALALCAGHIVRAQGLPFGDAFLPTLTFSESYVDTVVLDDFGYYAQVPDGSLTLNARVSMKDVVIEDLMAEENALVLDIGSLQLSLDLYYAERPPDGDGDGIPDKVGGYEVYTWLLTATNPVTGEDIDAGSIVMKFNATELKITVSAKDAPEDYSVYATQQRGSDEEIEDLAIPISVSVGPYSLESVLLYMNGTSSTFEKTVLAGTDEEQTFFLAKVNLSGLIDAVLPTVSVDYPGANARINDRPLTIRGKCSDRFGVVQVEVQTSDKSGTIPANAPWVPAVVSQGTWSLDGVEFSPGRPSIRARCVDSNGLVKMVTRFFYFSDLSDLFVSATGDSRGRVTSAYFPPLVYDPSVPSPVVESEHRDGAKLVITAVPGPTSVFDGWTSNKTLTPAQQAGARLSFKHEPNMTLTAKFIVNPFIPVKGRYNGLATGPTMDGSGFLSVTLAPNGSFTGSLKVGTLNLKLKGKFSNTGRYTQTVKVGGTEYVVDLTLNISGTGAEEITGTVKGGNIDVTIDAARAAFNKVTEPAPQAGTYNVIIPPAAGQSADYPIGIGFGRVTVSSSGAVRFAGRTGTTPTFNAGARLSADGTWPFFGSLYGKRGSLSGIVSFDLTNDSHDLSGTLNWFKPSGVVEIPVHTGGFSGQSTLLGAKFVTRAGDRLFLNASAGAGNLTLDALADGALPALQETLGVTLGTDNKLAVTATSPITEVKTVINPRTGQFAGTFFEGATASKFSGMIVNTKLNRGSGFFRRGSRTGAVEIVAP